MKFYSIKEVADILKADPTKTFTEDAIRKMAKDGRLPNGITCKKIGWQYIITAETDESLLNNFTKKFQRVKRVVEG